MSWPQNSLRTISLTHSAASASHRFSSGLLRRISRLSHDFDGAPWPMKIWALLLRRGAMRPRPAGRFNRLIRDGLRSRIMPNARSDRE